MFAGRESELRKLRDIESLDGVKTCMITGRRRVGKSELIKQFCIGRRSFAFEFSISTLEGHLRYMGDVISMMTGEARPEYRSMQECLRDIVSECRKSRTVVVFDEFQYMVADDEGNAKSSEIQRFIDTMLEGTDTMVIICGSHTSMMNELTDDPKHPLFGRFPNRMEIGELEPETCFLLHPGMSDLDNLKLYLTLGGIPSFHVGSSADSYPEFIWEVFMEKNAPLRNDVMLLIGAGIPADDLNRKMLRIVSEGGVTDKVIAKKMGIDKGSCTKKLSELVEMGVLAVKNPMYGAPGQPTYYVSEGAPAFYYGICVTKAALVDVRRKERTLERLDDAISDFLERRFGLFCREFLGKALPCIEVGSWRGPSDELDDNGKPEIVDIDVTARVEHGDAVFDLFGVCKMRRREAGFRELNTLVERVGYTKCNVNAAYAIFSTGGFTEDLTDYAERHGNMILADLDTLVGRKPLRWG